MGKKKVIVVHPYDRIMHHVTGTTNFALSHVAEVPTGKDRKSRK